MTDDATAEIQPWSSEEYRAILRRYAPVIADYTEAPARDAFCLIRHDVEFCVERAYRLAEIDAEEGVHSTFFFQVMNSAYNPLSTANRAMINRIQEMGHHVGLHFYVSHITPGDLVRLREELALQSKVLELITGHPIGRFSYHRPPRWVLEANEPLCDGMINAYASDFFELTQPGAMPSRVKYIADSQHKWHYGHPLENHAYEKFQILLHPDEWTEGGMDVVANFRDLIEDHSRQFVECIRGECKHYDLVMKD